MDIKEWIKDVEKRLEEWDDDRNCISIKVENKQQAKALDEIIEKNGYMLEFYTKEKGISYAIVDTNGVALEDF